MNHGCPNKCTSQVIKYGKYFRQSDSRLIQRFKCSECNKIFSSATFSECYYQKKRRINETLFKLICSGVSQRRAALILNVHPVTIARRMKFLSQRAIKKNKDFLEKLRDVEHIQFDDLITSHHTKLRPLSVTVAVDAKTRKILDMRLSQIPAFGHLSKISKRKYGYRQSYHKQALARLFQTLKPVVNPYALIESDEHKLYPYFVNRFFPQAIHKRYKSEVGCVAGQGELKKTRRDPLFKINHTLAMLRANINRLFRRTWCTSKDPGKLLMHLQIYQMFHNEYLV